MENIERVGFVIKPHAPDVGDILRTLIEYFNKKGIECFLEKVASELLGMDNGLPREEVPGKVNLMVVLGGDGTLLSIAHKAAASQVPVLGVNLGSLGFLTEVPLDEMFLTLDTLFQGDESIISPRRLLKVRIGGSELHCLNDLVINKGALARMIQLRIWIDDKPIADLRSDGLIISTPTGSTAYSLAAGGPIIHPLIPAVILAPICPHTLSFRPMVISGESRIRLQLITGDEEVYVTLDGQRGGQLHLEDSVEVCQSPYRLMLISSPERNYYDLLQEKLGWG